MKKFDSLAIFRISHTCKTAKLASSLKTTRVWAPINFMVRQDEGQIEDNAQRLRWDKAQITLHHAIIPQSRVYSRGEKRIICVVVEVYRRYTEGQDVEHSYGNQLAVQEELLVKWSPAHIRWRRVLLKLDKKGRRDCWMEPCVNATNVQALGKMIWNGNKQIVYPYHKRRVDEKTSVLEMRKMQVC